MDQGHAPAVGDLAVMMVAAADKVIAFRSLVVRARRSGNQAAFWSKRTALRALLPYFHSWHTLAVPVLPASLSAELSTALSNVDSAIPLAVSVGVRS